MISHEKKAVLHIAKSQLGLDDDTYRAILHEQGGVDSSRDLSDRGFDQVMSRFEELGFRNGARKRSRTVRRHGSPDALITRDQQRLIDEMYQQLGFADVARRTGFNRHQCGKAFPQTRTEANKVIEGLKAMIRRQQAKGVQHG